MKECMNNSALKDMNLSIDNQNKVIELINKKSLTKN